MAFERLRERGIAILLFAERPAKHHRFIEQRRPAVEVMIEPEKHGRDPDLARAGFVSILRDSPLVLVRFKPARPF